MIEATGVFSAPAASLREILLISEAFQADLPQGVIAADRVFTRENKGDRTFAVIAPGTGVRSTQIAGGSRSYHMLSGQLVLVLERNTNPEYYEDKVQADFDAGNFFGAVLDDIVLRSGDDQFLNMLEINLVDWGETHETMWNTLGRFYTAMIEINWGHE